eukprot:6035910-Alexandrium_andersonii.AAC.1
MCIRDRPRTASTTRPEMPHAPSRVTMAAGPRSFAERPTRSVTSRRQAVSMSATPWKTIWSSAASPIVRLVGQN